MAKSILTEKLTETCVNQGDVYKDIEYIEYALEKEGNVEFSQIVFPHVIVLTQACDLSQDYMCRKKQADREDNNHDKILISVLVAPIYNVELVYKGEHLEKLGMKMSTINKNKTPGKNLRNNETPRYHYLEFPEGVPMVPSVIDFKHYFSVNVQYLESIKEEKYICSISPLYREDISQRFASYLSRIGLPDIPK